MSEPVDKPAEVFPDAPIKPGHYGDYQVLEGKRVYHSGSAYPFSDGKPYFEMHAYRLQHSADEKPMVREIFERGKAVGVLLYNRDTQQVVVVRQFRLPTLASKSSDGMLVETIAGECKGGQDPKTIAIERTWKETGYNIKNPDLIAEYYSSPGGTSELILLYFAEVGDDDYDPSWSMERSGDRIEVIRWTTRELTEKLQSRQILDPKLLIAAYHLRARLGLRLDTDEKAADGEDDTRLIRQGSSQFTIGIKTGDILAVRGVDIWLNPENRYMMMSRFIDKGLSASIRWGGAEKLRSLAVTSDTIGNALRVAMGGRAEVDTVIETVPGRLARLGVKRLLHLPIAEAEGEVRARAGTRVERREIKRRLKEALRMAHDGEQGAWAMISRLRGRAASTSVLIPIIGAGEGQITPYHSTPEILSGIEEFLIEHPNTPLRQFWLLAYWKRELEACREELIKFAHKHNWSAHSSGNQPNN